MENTKVIPKKFRAMWNNHKTKLKIELPKEAEVTAGCLFVCSVTKGNGQTQITYTLEDE